MNILANAIDALDAVNVGAQMEANPPQIRIRTEVSSHGQTVAIRIQDNGPRMPEEIKARIFYHLFTTKFYISLHKFVFPCRLTYEGNSDKSNKIAIEAAIVFAKGNGIS